MQYIKGPDFPTGGIIMGLDGLRKAYNTGNGTIVIRSRCEIIEPKNKHQHTEIIVSEIPYGLRKSAILERIGQVAKEHVVDGITDLRDESSMKGMRIVIELRNDVNPQVVLNNLYKYTPLQTSYGINTIALVDGAPEVLGLKRCLEVYIEHQLEVITRRTEFDLDEDLKRMHILEGFIVAADNIEEVVKIIKESENGEEKDRLMARFNLSERQAQAILDMQLRRLSGLNREKTLEEYQGLEAEVAKLKEILASKENKEALLKTELLDIKARYADKRRSELQLHMALSIENEDLIPSEDVMITITEKGYAKRMKLDEYHSQNRGGVGVSQIKVKDNDHVNLFLYTNTHDYLLFFTNTGRIYKMKAYNIPEATKTSKGTPIVNIMQLKEGEKIAAITNMKEIKDSDDYLFFVTREGVVKRTRMSNFQNIMKSGIKAINLREGDEIYDVLVTSGNDSITLAQSNGKSITFKEEDIRDMGRSASGVRGMKLEEGSVIVGASVIKSENDLILALSANGYGKLTASTEYRVQSRGGKGVITLKTTEKNGKLVELEAVTRDLDLILTTNKGVTIRVHISDISESGRNSQGVRIVKLRENQFITNVAVVPHEDENEEALEETQAQESNE
jgi:DNA gyrase subunit A